MSFEPESILKRKTPQGWLSCVQPLEFSAEDLSWDDIDDDLLGHEPLPLLFGVVSSEMILADLKARDIDRRLYERGYEDLRVEMIARPMGQEALQLKAMHSGCAEAVVLMELKAYWGTLPLPRAGSVSSCRALVWDWLELRDPMASFSKDRPALPGQTAPGLAMFVELVDLVQGYVGSTHAEVLVTVPQYFHNAVIYQESKGLKFFFLDGLRQGQMIAQMRDLLKGEDGLYQATWAFFENRVEAQDGDNDHRVPWIGFPWTPSELVWPLTEEVAKALAPPPEEVDRGIAFCFRVRSTPHPDLEGSFHLA